MRFLRHHAKLMALRGQALDSRARNFALGMLGLQSAGKYVRIDKYASQIRSG